VAVLPMFPLGSPLLPGGVLPLHVFEPRYRQMVHDLLADDGPPEFGIVMIERGREVGGGETRRTTGTLAEVVDVRALEGGRYALMIAGRRRLRVLAWLPDDPYPLADIDFWDDDDTATLDPTAASSTIERLHERVRALNAQVRDLGEATPPPDFEIATDPQIALYHLGALSPLGSADRQRMLEAPAFSDRIEVFEGALDDAEAVVRFRSA
jgi:uncharacterized protein